MKTRHTCVRFYAAILCLCALAPIAQADDYYWTSSRGAGKNPDFDWKKNWDLDRVPSASSDRVFFTGTVAPEGVTTINMEVARNLDSLNFHNGWDLTLAQGGGGGLTLNSLTTSTSHTGNTAIDVPVTAADISSEGGTLSLSAFSGTSSIMVNGGSVNISGSVTASELAVNHSDGTGFRSDGGLNVSGKLSGIGTISGAVTVNGSHQVGVGQGGIGTQRFTDHLTYSSSSIFNWDLNPGSSDYDRVVVDGLVTGTSQFVVNIGGGSFQEAFWDQPRSWNDIVGGGDGSDSLASIFTSITGAGIGSNGMVEGQGQFTFTGNTLNWMSVASAESAGSMVPEPNSLLFGTLLASGLLRRRRYTAEHEVL